MNEPSFYYTLMLADDALLMGHRLSEWTAHGPILEQDIAISNIALDYIGQARNFYQHACVQKNDGSTEDDLAYLRDAFDFRNHLISELPNGDWAVTMMKLFCFSNYQVQLYRQLQVSGDEQISAIAEKSLKEALYHLRWSSEWIIRLGDGTDESHQRVLTAYDQTFTYSGELYSRPSYDAGFVDYEKLSVEWWRTTREVFQEATIQLPEATDKKWMQSGGIEGRHTEHLGFILAEMQFLQRAYPGAKW